MPPTDAENCIRAAEPSTTGQLEQQPSGTAPSLSEQMAAVRAEVEELARVLGMASRVATLLDQPQASEQGRPPPSVGPVGLEDDAGPAGSKHPYSAQVPAVAVQGTHGDALQRLVNLSLSMARRLLHNASQTVGGLAGKPGGSGDRPGHPNQRTSNPFRLAPQPGADVPDRRVDRLPVPRSLPSGTQAPHLEPHGVGWPSQPEPFLQTRPWLSPKSGSRPLDGWVRAVGEFYSLLPAGPPRLSGPNRPHALPGATAATIETRITLHGASGFPRLIAVRRALAGLPGILWVGLTRFAPDGADLAVRHAADLDLAGSVAAALGNAARVQSGEFGSLRVQMGGQAARLHPAGRGTGSRLSHNPQPARDSHGSRSSPLKDPLFEAEGPPEDSIQTGYHHEPEEFALLRRHLCRIADPRRARRKLHPTDGALGLTLLALAAGARSIPDVARYGESHPALLEPLGLTRVPSAATLRRLLGAVTVEALRSSLASFTEEVYARKHAEAALAPNRGRDGGSPRWAEPDGQLPPLRWLVREAVLVLDEMATREGQAEGIAVVEWMGRLAARIPGFAVLAGGGPLAQRDLRRAMVEGRRLLLGPGTRPE